MFLLAIEVIMVYLSSFSTYLLGRNVEGDCSQVDLAVGVDAGNYEKYTRAAGAALQQTTKPEYNNSLVLLHNLDTKK